MAPHNVEVEAITDTTGVPLPDPLTAAMPINDIRGRRKKAEKTTWGVAAPASSERFKSYSHTHKPKAKRWDHYISTESKSRKGNSLKNAAKYLGKPGLISLGGGLPSSEYFPFDSLDLTMPAVANRRRHSARGKHDLAEDKSIFDIATAFNYGQGHGAAQLLRWVTEHTELVHNPPYADWACHMTVGSTSALDMSLRIFTEPGRLHLVRGLHVLRRQIETAAPLGVKVARVVLTNWDPAARGGARKPFVLYTVPSGQNPTGATQGANRRREIYKDEPYYFLANEPYGGADAATPEPPSSHAASSWRAWDVDGRVLRMDSFSKVVSPAAESAGLTGADASTGAHPGYIDWLIHIRKEYTHRRDVMLRACDKYLPKDVVSWKPPMAGITGSKSTGASTPHASPSPLTELEDEIFMLIIDHGALVMKGSWFYAEPDAAHDTMFFRATFAAAPADKIQEAIHRFGDAIRPQLQAQELICLFEMRSF
ncbi:aromatic amino acid aminotransferase 1 [Phyllosticta capitalensis]